MIASAIVWHVLLLLFAQMQTLAGGIVTLLVVGIAQSLAMVSLTVILVRESGQRFRGRVMGVRMLAIYTLPVGLLVAGALIERIGFAATATLYAVVGLACHDHHRAALARAPVAGGRVGAGGISRSVRPGVRGLNHRQPLCHFRPMVRGERLRRLLIAWHNFLAEHRRHAVADPDRPARPPRLG